MFFLCCPNSSGLLGGEPTSRRCHPEDRQRQELAHPGSVPHLYPQERGNRSSGSPGARKEELQTSSRGRTVSGLAEVAISPGATEASQPRRKEVSSHFTEEEVETRTAQQSQHLNQSRAGKVGEGMASVASEQGQSSQKRASSLCLCLLMKHLHGGLRKQPEGMRGGFALSPEFSGPQRACLPSVPSAHSPPAPARTSRSPPPSAQVGCPTAQPSPRHHAQEGGREVARLTGQGWWLGMQMGVGQRLNVPWDRCGHRRRPGRARLAAGLMLPEPLLLWTLGKHPSCCLQIGSLRLSHPHPHVLETEGRKLRLSGG